MSLHLPIKPARLPASIRHGAFNPNTGSSHTPRERMPIQKIPKLQFDPRQEVTR